MYAFHFIPIRDNMIIHQIIINTLIKTNEYSNNKTLK